MTQKINNYSSMGAGFIAAAVAAGLIVWNIECVKRVVQEVSAVEIVGALGIVGGPHFAQHVTVCPWVGYLQLATAVHPTPCPPERATIC